MVDTLKTAVVVVLLLAVLYGVYVVLNKPEQYPQQLAWEADAADPALQIELGMPETAEEDSADADTDFTSSLGSPAQPSYAVTEVADHASQIANGSSGFSLDAPSDGDLSDQTSLPIPEPTAPTASSITPPDLLGAAQPATDSFDVPGMDVNNAPTEGNELPANGSPTEIANALRDSNGFESNTDRFGSSNRYSGSSPLREDANTDLASASGIPTPLTAAQANVNDITENATDSVADSFQAALEAVQMKIDAEAWKDALHRLSSYYNDPNLNATEFSQLVDLLDPLAGKVIYSTEHLMEPAYQSQAGDTLKNIADRYEIPWQLLANINGIENPEASLAGRQLKVVRGPFRAEISLGKNELTLFVDKLYAGRFPITIGNSPAPVPGQYHINDKQPGRTYYAGDGQTISIDDPNNPYGRMWLDLGNDLSIHGSSPNGASPGQGCIALTSRDAADIYGILSKGSSVVILP